MAAIATARMTALARPISPALRGVHPAREEEVGLVTLGIPAVGGPDQPAAVGAEMREAVEARGGGDALGDPARLVHEVEIELPSVRRAHVAAPEDAPPVREEGRAEVGGAVRRELARIGTVGPRDVQLERVGADQALLKE